MRCWSAVVVGLVACGRVADEPAPAPVAPPLAEPPIAITSTPWLVTHEFASPSGEGGALRASHFVGGAVETVLLDPWVREAQWSPSGNWFVYESVSASDDRALWMRRLEDDAWSAPQLVQTLGADFIGSIVWSPTSEQLVFTRQSSGHTAGVLLVTPGVGAAPKVTSIDGASGGDSSQSNVQWSPRGDRIVVTIDGANEAEAIHDLDAAGAVHAITFPAGGQRGVALPSEATKISPDGAWLVASELDPSAVNQALLVYPTDGVAAPRDVPGCSLGDSRPCVGGYWTPNGATLLYTRGTVVQGWDVDADRTMTISTDGFGGWLAPGSARFLSDRFVAGVPKRVVDVTDPLAVVIGDVPTSDLPNPVVVASPDGAWLAVGHTGRDGAGIESAAELVDLHGAPPWTHHELYRTAGNLAVLSWSPAGRFLVLEESAANAIDGMLVDRDTGAAFDVRATFASADDDENHLRTRISSDDAFLAVPLSGTLGVVPAGTPPSRAAALAGVPDTARVLWRPRSVH